MSVAFSDLFFDSKSFGYGTPMWLRKLCSGRVKKRIFGVHAMRTKWRIISEFRTSCHRTCVRLCKEGSANVCARFRAYVCWHIPTMCGIKPAACQTHTPASYTMVDIHFHFRTLRIIYHYDRTHTVVAFWEHIRQCMDLRTRSCERTLPEEIATRTSWRSIIMHTERA